MVQNLDSGLENRLNFRDVIITVLVLYRASSPLHYGKHYMTKAYYDRCLLVDKQCESPSARMPMAIVEYSYL